MNAAQGFNSLGTTLAPIIGATIFLAVTSFSGVMGMYAVLGAAFILLGAVIWFSIPKTKEVVDTSKLDIGQLFKHPIMVAGMFAIFMYVGGEVAIGSNLVTYLTEQLHVTATSAGLMLGIYWGGAMIGRFLGSIAMSKSNSQRRLVSMLITAVVLLLLIGGLNMAKGLPLTPMIAFSVIVILSCAIFYRVNSSRTLLTVFAVVNSVIVIIAAVFGGALGAYLLLAAGLFNSIMWSNIFDIATETAPPELVSAASSLLIMMIFGGALLPPLQGWLADTIGIRLSFFVPLISYIYIFCFALFSKRLEK